MIGDLCLFKLLFWFLFVIFSFVFSRTCYIANKKKFNSFLRLISIQEERIDLIYSQETNFKYRKVLEEEKKAYEKFLKYHPESRLEEDEYLNQLNSLIASFR